jgi:enediyne biosynthesis protein E4
MAVEDPKKFQSDEEEVAHLDERTVSRAFAWSGLAFVIIVGAVIAGILFAKRNKPKQEAKLTRLTAPAAAQSKVAEVPVVTFTDVTADAGIKFVHNNGAYGEKLLPETMGSGVAFLDFDNDGDADLLFINSADWPWRKVGRGVLTAPGDASSTARRAEDNAPYPTMALYRNDVRGKFADVTAGSGLDVSFYGTGVAVGDFDNDGNTDVFITGVGKQRLFRNLGGGKFQDVTDAMGMKAEPGAWSTAACFFDYDNDGKLDLFVGHYVKWSREIDAEVGYKIDGKTRAYGQPMNFQGTFPRLFHNDGAKFTDVSAQAGVQVKAAALGAPSAKTLGVVPTDLDGDGFMDLVVANDTTPNFVFHNQKNGTFKECGATCGVAFDSYGNTRGAMGIDAAHFRNDASLGIAIGNFANEMTALYVSQPGGMFFTDEAIPEGIGPASRLLLKFGVFFFDYDLDGRLDVLSANGHLDEEIVKLQKSQSYRQPAQLFWNTGAKSGATFVAVDEQHAGKDLFKPLVGRASAFADIDGDGDLDVVLTQAGGAPLLLRNDQQLKHHWLRVKLIGTRSNHSAIGAKVVAKVGGQTLIREVNSARSYLSASELPITFGLGTATKVDSLEITWPSGRKQTLTAEKIDALLTIEEPR